MRNFLTLAALLAVLALLIPFVSALLLPGMGMQPAVDLPPLTVTSSGAEESASPQSTAQQSQEPDREEADETAEADGISRFRIYDRGTGEIFELDAGQYILGALASEMPPSFHQEALRAQAVAAHTWAVYSAAMHREYPDETILGADFSVDTTRDEGYLSQERFFSRYGATAELYWPKLTESAEWAATRLLFYDGEPALAVYHAMSCGMTEASENVWQAALPYLVPVESKGDLLSPDYQVTETFDQKTMRYLLEQAFDGVALDEGDPAGWIQPLETSPSGYLISVQVGDQTVHGQALRHALSLRSSCMEVSFSGGTFTIETRGYGHGVGMSQYGADFMARQGTDCAGILAHYYPGTELVQVSRTDGGA